MIIINKEDAFLKKIEQAVVRGAQIAAQEIRASGVINPENPLSAEAEVEDDADFTEAMKFIDALCN